MTEKKKRRNSSINISDDLPIVKAAAWAWYQHGSGSEGKAMCEFDATTTPLRPPNYKPSRYKMEAIKIIQQPFLDQQYSSSSTTPTHDHEYSKNHSLLDAYEVEKISKQLDQLILSNSNRFNGFDDDNHNNKDLDNPKSSEIVKIKNNIKKKSLLKGLWSRHSVVCGTRDDVVSGALVRTMPLPTTKGGRARGDGLLVSRNHLNKVSNH